MEGNADDHKQMPRPKTLRNKTLEINATPGKDSTADASLVS